MQPILMLAIVGVAAVALGTGFLNNNIDLWIQQFGVGAGDISTPIEHITVDFNIVQQEILDSTGAGTGVFENVVDSCILKLDTAVGDPEVDVKDSELTCKLTGHDDEWLSNDLIITEGTLCADSFPAGDYVINMGRADYDDDPLGLNPTPCRTAEIVLGTPTSVDVRDVGDVIVVAHADSYTGGDHAEGQSSLDCEEGEVLNPLNNVCEPEQP